jgi:hypothetical protein
MDNGPPYGRGDHLTGKSKPGEAAALLRFVLIVEREARS